MTQPFDLGRTLLAKGTAERRARHRRAARETLEQAAAIFDELGAVLWARKARAELARIGGRAPSGDELTPSEQRIAELVAEGKTNKEIGAAMYLSAKTIEYHLANTYRKLDIHSRAELARIVTQDSGAQ